MPVYDRGYVHWEPSEARAWPAWWVIARRGIAQPLRNRWLFVLLLGTWIMPIIKGAMIYTKLRAGDVVDLIGGGWANIDPPAFLALIEHQRFFVFVLLAIAGAGLVANDRRDNGLSLYFSRPLGLRSYLGGKALIVMFFYFMVTLAQIYALCIYAFFIAADSSITEQLLLTPLRATLYCVFTGGSMSLVLLALSSMGTRSIFVMVWWAVLVQGTEVIGNIAAGFNQDSLQIVNFFGQYHNVGALFFGAEPRLGFSPWISLLVVLGWTALAALVLKRRIKPVEVVS